ncbi:MAG: hypothetical protein ACYDAB_12830 [bacterium]
MKTLIAFCTFCAMAAAVVVPPTHAAAPPAPPAQAGPTAAAASVSASAPVIAALPDGAPPDLPQARPIPGAAAPAGAPLPGIDRHGLPAGGRPAGARPAGARPAAPSSQESWPFGHVELGGMNGSTSQLIYVPKGQVFRNAAVEADVRPMNPTELTVRLDDRTLYTHGFADPGPLNVPLGDLSAGFHRITLIAVDHGLVWEPTGQQRNACFALTPTAIVIDRERMRYVPVWVRDPRISELPDALFNSSAPGRAPLIGEVAIEPLSDAGASAALRLATMFSATRPLEWQVKGAEGSLPADFRVVIRQDPTADGPAVIRVAPGEVEVTYRDAMGLDIAVNALLNEGYRGQIASSRAVLSGAQPPAWGGLKPPATLADLGIPDQQLAGRAVLDLTLVFPPYWAPTGLPRGFIAVRPVQGLQTGAGMWAWIDGALAGSASLAGRPGGSDVRMRVDGPRTPASPSISLRIEASLLGSADCTTVGVAWLNAHASTMELPHRIKKDVGGITPTLVGAPRLVVQPTPEAVQAAIALAERARDATDGAPVPFIVHLGTKPAEEETVYVGTDRPLVEGFGRSQATSLYGDLLAHSTLLHATETDVRVIGADAAALVWFSRYWGTIDPAVPDGATDVMVTADGYMQSYFSAHKGEGPVRAAFSVRSPWVSSGALAGVFLAIVAAMLMLRARPRGR